MPRDEAIAHHIEITPTGSSASMTHRNTYRVVCYTCKLVLHEATTGPVHWTKVHFEGDEGYERPMRDDEMPQDKAIEK